MIIDELFEGPQMCPECGGISFSDLILAEKKDACYYKVKASAKVWPSAYASGRLVQCRKKGAANYGNSKNEGVAEVYNLITGALLAYDEHEKNKGMAEDQLDEKWSDKYKRSINCANPRGFSQRAHCAGRKKNENVAENAGQSLSVQQLATISDEALDNAYHYGRSTPGNTFGWQANLKSAAYAKQMIDQGVTDIEAISDAIHKGWNTTAQAFVQNPDQFDDTAKLAAAGKLEAKLQQRAQLMKQNYAQLPEEEKEKDRVVARALLKAIRGEQGVSETLGKQIHSTFQSMGDSFSDAHLAKGISYFLQGRHQEGENWLRGKIPAEAQAAVFGKLRTLQAQGGVDVNKNANVQQYIDDKLVPWVKNQIQASVKEGEEPKTIWHGGLTISGPGSDAKAQQLDIDHELDEGGDVFMANIQNTPEYKAGFATGKLPVPYPEGTQQYASYYKGVIDKASPTLSKVGEGEQRKGADYRDPREVDYDDEYDAMVARVKKLAGLGPLKTVYDPGKRQYRNMPTAQQPKK